MKENGRSRPIKSLSLLRSVCVNKDFVRCVWGDIKVFL